MLCIKLHRCKNLEATPIRTVPSSSFVCIRWPCALLQTLRPSLPIHPWARFVGPSADGCDSHRNRPWPGGRWCLRRPPVPRPGIIRHLRYNSRSACFCCFLLCLPVFHNALVFVYLCHHCLPFAKAKNEGFSWDTCQSTLRSFLKLLFFLFLFLINLFERAKRKFLTIIYLNSS